MKQKQKNNDLAVKLDDRIHLKRDAVGAIWHYYFRLAGKQYRSTTKTADLHKATSIARQAYADLDYRLRNGETLETVSFKKLVKKYLESIAGKTANKIKGDTGLINRRFMAYFGKLDDVSKINKGMLNNYVIWRRDIVKQKVTNSSLNREGSVLNQILRMGYEHGWIKQQLKLGNESAKYEYNRREDFKDAELNKLLKTSEQRIEEYRSDKLSKQERGRLTNKLWERQLLHDMIILLLNTGMRVDESKTVTWGNVDLDAHEIKLKKAGKKNEQRPVIVKSEGIAALKRLKARREEWCKNKGKTFSEKDYVQAMPNGERVGDLRGGFNGLLGEAGLEYESKTEKHVLTSLRYTYATRMLKAAKITVDQLATQMGTSPAMIKKHYGHVTARDYKNIILDANKKVPHPDFWKMVDESDLVR